MNASTTDPIGTVEQHSPLPSKLNCFSLKNYGVLEIGKTLLTILNLPSPLLPPPHLQSEIEKRVLPVLYCDQFFEHTHSAFNSATSE